jgi:uncharacterized membrane protein YdjX (TVP38/TMEM64 family)
VFYSHKKASIGTVQASKPTHHNLKIMMTSTTSSDSPQLSSNDHNSSSVVEVPLGEANNMTPEPEPTEEGLTARKKKCYKKAVVAVILVAFIAFLIADSLTNGFVKDGINNFLEWIEANPVGGIFVFMLVYFVATVLFVPGSILTLGAGFVFANTFGLGAGVLLGTLAVFFGASAGAIVSFLLGRFLLRDWVSGLTKKHTIFEALDNAFEEKGFRIMALLRLSPIIPFNAINYIAGVTAISFWAYFWALFAILPGTILYVFLGASAGSLAESANSSGGSSTVTIIVIVIGIIFGFLAVAFTSYYAKKELNKVTAKRQAELNAVAKDGKDEETGEMGDRTMGDDEDQMSAEAATN